MQFTTFAVFAVSALVAVAAPTEQSKEQPKGTDPDCTTTSSAIQHAETTPPTGSSSGSAPGQVNASGCKNTQVQSCCNGDQDLAILGGNCFIPLISGQCTGNEFCCETEQNGLINVGSICLPLTL